MKQRSFYLQEIPLMINMDFYQVNAEPEVNMPGSHSTAWLPLYCRATTVLPGSHCTVGLPLYCRTPIVLPDSHCIARLPLYYRALAESKVN